MLHTGAGGASAASAGGRAARFVLAVDRLTTAVASLLRRIGRNDADTASRAVIAEMVGAVAMARVQTDDGKAEQMLAAVRESVKGKLGLSA